MYLHKLERRFEIFHWVHLNAEELDPHNEADSALEHIWALLFLPELLQLCDELLPHRRKPGKIGKEGLPFIKIIKHTAEFRFESHHFALAYIYSTSIYLHNIPYDKLVKIFLICKLCWIK